METRGRKSAAELTVIGASGIETIRRPVPPSELTDEQAEEWRAIVDRMAADWFPRETHGMLLAYCRHVVSAKRVAQLIADHEKSEDFNVNDYDKLLKMQEREGRAISSLATRMRLSQHSSYDKKKAKPIQGKRPWER
jgi:hypothetical protein